MHVFIPREAPGGLSGYLFSLLGLKNGGVDLVELHLGLGSGWGDWRSSCCSVQLARKLSTCVA